MGETIKSLKSGDQIVIKGSLEEGVRYGTNIFVSDMEGTKGNVLTISSLYPKDEMCTVVESIYNFSSEMINWDKTKILNPNRFKSVADRIKEMTL